jgi:hypothetical protein
MIESKGTFPVFTVSNPDAARPFYADNLGVEVVFRVK